MDARDATANNADLWTQYLRHQWRLFLDPFGIADPQITNDTASALADAAASTVASALTALIGPQIGRMCHEEAIEVDAALGVPEEISIPPDYAAHPPASCTDATQQEAWRVSAPPVTAHAVEAY